MTVEQTVMVVVYVVMSAWMLYEPTMNLYRALRANATMRNKFLNALCTAGGVIVFWLMILMPVCLALIAYGLIWK